MSAAKSIALAGGIAVVCAMPPLRAYEPPTHAQITAQAVSNSILGPNCASQGRCALSDLGLQLLPTDPTTDNQVFPNWIKDSSGNPVADNWVTSSSSRTVSDLFQDGAQFEDNGTRALNHFFDPVSGNPLSASYIPTTLLQLVGRDYTSPDWALEDNGPVLTQSFSYAHARQYFFDALTNINNAQRAQSWGKLFQTLGQVMHHVQDMAQPQHVRNDPHLDEHPLQIAGVSFNPLYNPSVYEKYSADPQVHLPLSTSYPALDPTVFTTPRSLWSNGGKGIAEFTNANFFSDGTNVDSGKYSLPTIDPTLVQVYDIQTLCTGVAPVCPSGVTGSMYFIGSHITDQNTGANNTNLRATTYSLLSSDLQKINSQQLFTLNRFNFDAAHPFLIGHAVAYSTALINHFFRGQMAISLPNEGVYAAIDHTLEVNSDPTSGGGFPTVRLKVQNLTQDGVNGSGQPIIEPMNVQGQPVGQLTAIARYHLNNCYTASLSGEYGSPGIQAANCRDPAESVSVSNAISVPSGIDSSPQEVAFTFPNRIPIQATDLFLQVVYQGPLGGESNAVVVTTKDISEPTYLYNYSRWDQFTYCSTYPALNFTGCQNPLSYAQWCASGFTSQTDCNQAMSLTLKIFYSPTSSPVAGFDPNQSTTPAQNTLLPLSQEPTVTTPVVVMPAPVGTYARVALLLDSNPQNVAVIVQEAIDTEHNTAQFQWSQVNPVFSTVNQCSPYANNACNEVIQGQTQTMTISRTYAPARTATNPSIYAISNDGTPGQTDDATLLNQGTANPMPPILPSLSTVNF